MLKLIHHTGDASLATVHVLQLADGAHIECVESVQPPVPRSEKWVLIVSTLKGCPVNCPICDAGGSYRGKLTADEIMAQIDHLVRLHFPDGNPTTPKLKIQFARMGDPAFNDAVLDVLRRLPETWPNAGIMASVSTVAPAGREAFFAALTDIKNNRYAPGSFQMQFSLHTTDEQQRRRLVPTKTWTFNEMARWGATFYREGDRKVTLNFAAARDFPLDPAALRSVFDPRYFLIKLTPINPTHASQQAGICGLIDPETPERNMEVVAGFEQVGYDVILSIGETRENQIGSNCGMYIRQIQTPDR